MMTHVSTMRTAPGYTYAAPPYWVDPPVSVSSRSRSQAVTWKKLSLPCMSNVAGPTIVTGRSTPMWNPNAMTPATGRTSRPPLAIASTSGSNAVTASVVGAKLAVGAGEAPPLPPPQ